MPLKCLLSIYAFLLFWGTIGVFVFPSLLIYFMVYPFMKYPQDVFQMLAATIYKIFFKLLWVVELRFEGENKIEDGAIYIATHQSSLDYPILGSFIKKYLTITNLNFIRIPFASFVGKLIGARSLPKNNLGEISLVYKEFEEILEKDRNIIIFPEGTRDNGKQLKEFKKGAFRLSKKTNKPIVPIVIDGSAKLLAKDKACFQTSTKTRVNIKILQPLYPQNFKNEDEMMKKAFSLMQYRNNN